MSRSDHSNSKYRKKRQSWIVGITVEGKTVMSTDTPNEQLIVRRVFHVFNPQRSAEVRSWLDVVKDQLAHYA